MLIAVDDSMNEHETGKHDSDPYRKCFSTKFKVPQQRRQQRQKRQEQQQPKEQENYQQEADKE